MPAPDLLKRGRGSIDGRKFFSRSPFRSGHFLAATAVCLAAVALDLCVLVEYWQQLPSLTACMLFLVGSGVVGTWWRALGYLDRAQELYMVVSLKGAEPDSRLDIALGVIAEATIDMLYSVSITLLLLGCLWSVLGRAGH
jgi:hypothetical protein